MISAVETQIDESGTKESLRWRIAMGGALAGTALIGYFLQHKLHLTQTYDQPWRALSESMSHPAPGYAGAWVANAGRIARGEKPSLKLAIAGSMAGNLAAEVAQDLHLRQFNVLEDGFLREEQCWIETPKDALFALGGAALLAYGEQMRQMWTNFKSNLLKN